MFHRIRSSSCYQGNSGFGLGLSEPADRTEVPEEGVQLPRVLGPGWSPASALKLTEAGLRPSLRGLLDSSLPSSRWNAFEVLALDGVSSGILRFYTAQDGADWLRAVSANIRELTLQNVSTRCF